MTVLPGVMSTDSPAAALDTWNNMLDTTPDAPVVALAFTMTEPFNSNVPRASARPALMVSFALSLENRTVDRVANAKTDETTTKAISTIAVSRPVIPLSSRPNRRDSFKSLTGALLMTGCLTCL